MKRNLIALVAGFIALFLANGLVYGGLLGSAFETIMARAPEGSMHQAFHYVVFGHFAQTVLLVGILSRMNVASPKEGFFTSAALHFGMFTVFDCFILSALTIFQPLEMVVDVFANSLTGGFGGLVIAFVFQRLDGPAKVAVTA